MKPLSITIAKNEFNKELNCAQSLLYAGSHSLNFDREMAMQISCGFGAGMGRMQDVCGAVSGSFMLLGLYSSMIHKQNSERKEKTAVMIRDFSTIFKSVHKTLKCAELLNCDLNSAEGQKYFEQNNLKKMVCEKCISSAISILNELIIAENSKNQE